MLSQTEDWRICGDKKQEDVSNKLILQHKIGRKNWIKCDYQGRNKSRLLEDGSAVSNDYQLWTTTICKSSNYVLKQELIKKKEISRLNLTTCISQLIYKYAIVGDLKLMHELSPMVWFLRVNPQYQKRRRSSLSSKLNFGNEQITWF
jgi:hypothetical protein